MKISIASAWDSLKSGQPLFMSAVPTPRSSEALIILDDWLSSDAAQTMSSDWVNILALYQEGRYADTLKLLEKNNQGDFSVLLLEAICLLHLDSLGEKFKRYLALNYLRDNVLSKLRAAVPSDKTGRSSLQIEWLERFSQGYELNLTDLERGETWL